jgi:hypothetical protein
MTTEACDGSNIYRHRLFLFDAMSGTLRMQTNEEAALLAQQLSSQSAARLPFQ